MFSKILIANRGEIACRVIKTARRMGIKTVAVYSDADADALHVLMADEKVHIGAAPAAESYLIADKIVEAAKKTGAEAIHPGYGFLSENATFCNRLKEEGIAFIGPGVKAIGAMGDKIESKKLAAEAGVSTVPGYMGVIKDADEAVKIAGEIGYPVMIKASAGGGGKGMRVAYNDEEARDGFLSATNEARSSFADDRVFVEKFIEEPRHIEIQVLGDSHGNVIYLGERECSIQRRHQKVIEEAPSPFIDAETRKAMGEQAVALSHVVDYQSAGTVEFIVDKERNFYFLEMNTRLQVEHPVTEMITGIDLVEQMIRVAYGEKLTITQDDVKLNGWAMESRIYAEDPLRGFLPSIGRVSYYVPPEESDFVRVDTGIYEGSEISMYYDPMIAKLVTYGANRDEAIQHMRKALDDYYIRGVGHNIAFLSDVMNAKRFQEGSLTTNYIAEEYPDGFTGGTLTDETRLNMVAVAMVVHAMEFNRARNISGRILESSPAFDAQWIVSVGQQDHVTGFFATEDGCMVSVDKENMVVITKWVPGKKVFAADVNGRDISVEVDYLDDGYLLTHDGASEKVTIYTERQAELAALMPEKLPPDTSRLLLCPMPGLVVSVNVEKGDEVKAGQILAVVEAMKMENNLRAERDGVVLNVPAKAGDSLAVDDVIIEFE
ncbi:acetyl/propionyl/methylcrotonyl-CoA carboxylase subunit alpha [Emcibacter sp.]|uniref:acetyl/propionyl/methylcrotonyl-CoA carboxylase subunit alpha n=1 Tax=Emcibacter sp. TaxID=1979954 RepID=UPI002AA93405|nr:acetyl/propionyl/methylcrotonyl-CoA carboxylase subunit alpha [Emcibacter sp.]